MHHGKWNHEKRETYETSMELEAEMRRLGYKWIAEKSATKTECMGLIILQFADRIEAAAKRERDEMLDALVRIGNWCAQDLAENAFTSDGSGNYLKTLNGLCEICRPFMQRAAKLKEYGGAE